MKQLIVGFCIVITLSTAAMSQTRNRTTTRHPATSKTSASAAAAAVRSEGATKLATQIKNLSTFLYLVGGVARGIEAIDAAANGQPSPTNEKNKAQLRSSFGDFRAAMDSLEVYFRTTPELQPYYTKLVGSAAGAASAEQQAAAGQFTPAGKTLLGVVGRLADVLVAMQATP